MKAKFLLIMFAAVSILSAEEFRVDSPKGRLQLNVNVDNGVSFSVLKNGFTLVGNSGISLELYDGKLLGSNPVLTGSSTRLIDETLKPVVKQKYESIQNFCNELLLSFAGGYKIIFRVYDDAVAYRFRTELNEKIRIKSELAEFNFGRDYQILFPEEKSFMSHSERLYLPLKLSEVTSERFCSLPALVNLENGIKAVITESDLEDYPGLYLSGSDENPNSLKGIFPYYPARDTVRNDRDVYVVERKDYMAETSGKRNFPWRIVAFSENDGDLITNTIVYKLAKPSDPGSDFSWVKPGKVAWDWWNYNNIYGVDFRAGVNNNTYKYFIDFASKYDIEYIILDEGWYKLGNLLQQSPDINIEELVDYGNKKNVGIILWMSWKTLDDQFTEAMDLFSRWGIKGIKVDFMQRDDQWMVNYYYKVAEEAAKRKLLVNFHGAYKPTGLYRTYPNVITSEGVLGLEQSKWSDKANPWMAVTLPFIRMFAGPMDYTPGAMINATNQSFKPIFTVPMSQGTRAHQLAMYVVFESPLQMLADNPTHYYKEPECMEFLSKVPTVWDDTKVLDAVISEYILIARQSKNQWYIGAITNWTPRDLTIDFSFLPDGDFKIKIWQDGINADRNANDYKLLIQNINNKTKLNIHLAPGGGWVGIISK
ncbi:MAG TPA: glycoside hydrolase family 97 protein [Melioribacteraceae bacterium]|nr:glycoside hydrolase family 97 protein [Melioribacteraceae bacterium]